MNKKTIEMVQLAVLIAILLIMAFTPLGYLKTAGLEISLLTIPVVIGAMVIGPGAGAILGLCFGLTSFYQCFGLSVFGAALLNMNPFITFLVCVPTRVLMGWLTGLIFKAVSRMDKTRTLSWFVGGLCGAFLNTLLFMGVMVLGFWQTDYIQELSQLLGSSNAVMFIILFVGVNGLLEMPATCIAGGVVSKALDRAFRNIRQGTM